MFERPSVTRREMLKTAAWGLVSLTGLVSAAWPAPKTFEEPKRNPYRGSDDQLLDEIERAAFDFFWNEASSATGQVRDRALVSGNDHRRVASIAATGFGLTALCIGEIRGYGDSAAIQSSAIQASAIQARVRQTLRFLKRQSNEHGFFYHFVDMDTGERMWNCEVSSIDTSLLLCGVLTARQHFHDPEIEDLATAIYERVDWPWMLNGGDTFSMGWHPGGGFLRTRWDHYCELMMIYLLALGSPTHPVPSETWKAWTRPTVKFQEFEYISGRDPLFTHQYSHAWFDFRHKRDAFTDYFTNSVIATEAHKRFCISLHDEFPDYSGHLWGITASDSASGYRVWGGPPRMGRLDGSVVPCAAGGSLPFLQGDCMEVLRTIRECYPKAWGRYGFVDAFNPLSGWYDRDVLGIDVGITMLMAENARSGFVWETFMKNKEMRSAMEKAGFKADAGQP
jgi:hypothetical protein